MRQREFIPHIASSEITAESAYLKRRDFVRALGLAAVPTMGGFSASVQASATTGGSALTYEKATSGASGFRTD
jgi:hypothetical protein